MLSLIGRHWDTSCRKGPPWPVRDWVIAAYNVIKGLDSVLWKEWLSKIRYPIVVLIFRNSCILSSFVLIVSESLYSYVRHVTCKIYPSHFACWIGCIFGRERLGRFQSGQVQFARHLRYCRTLWHQRWKRKTSWFNSVWYLNTYKNIHRSVKKNEKRKYIQFVEEGKQKMRL